MNKKRLNWRVGLMGTLGLVLLAPTVYAAELYGRLTNVPNGARLTVACGDFSSSLSIAANGTYRVTGIPANSTCSFELTTAGAASSKVWIPIRSAGVAFNATIRVSGSRIVILQN